MKNDEKTDVMGCPAVIEGTGLTPEAVDTAIGERYKVIRHLGKGSQGSVFLVRDNKLDKCWALKVVREMTGDELNALKRVDHPAFPRIVDVIETALGTGLIMDHISGMTIGEYASVHRISIDMLYEWTLEIAGALRYLHSISPVILYMDCKPSNIIYGEDGHIHLVDLGSAYIPELSSSHRLSGTLPYAAPEQRQGTNVDPRSDIYALGVTIKTIGNLPDHRFTLLAYLKYRHDRDKRLRALLSIISRCIESRPSDRYQTTDELIYQLTHPESIPYRLPSADRMIHRLSDVLYKNAVTLFCVLSFHMYAHTGEPPYMALGMLLFTLLIALSLRHGQNVKAGIWHCYKDVYLRDLSSAALMILLCALITMDRGYAAEPDDAIMQDMAETDMPQMPSKHGSAAPDDIPDITIYDSEGAKVLYKGQYAVRDGENLYLYIPVDSLSAARLPARIEVR